MNLAAWLLTIAGPLVVRALAYIGIVAATVTGVDVAFAGLLTQLQTSSAAMPPTVLQLLGLAGAPQAIGIIWGAFNARLTLWIALASTRWITSK